MYRLIHNLSGYGFGSWYTYEEAECYRNMMDDWMNWSVEKI